MDPTDVPCVRVSVHHAVTGSPLAVLELDPSSNVDDFRQTVATMRGWPRITVQLLLGARLLQDGQTIANAGLVDGSSVGVICRRRRLISTSWDCTAKVWNVGVSNGECELTLRHNCVVFSAGFSPCSGFAITGCGDCQAWLWNLSNGRCEQQFSGHLNIVSAASFSPNSNSILTASWDHTARIWNVESTECTMIFEGHSTRVHSAVFCSDGHRVATGDGHGVIRIWDARKGVNLQTWTGHRQHSDIFGLAFVPKHHGHALVSTSRDETVKLWNADAGEEVSTLRGHEDAVNSVALSPDGARIATVSDDGILQFWSVEGRKSLERISCHDAAARSVSYSPDGLCVATGSDDCSVKVWRIKDHPSFFLSVCSLETTLEGHRKAVCSVAFEWE